MAFATRKCDYLIYWIMIPWPRWSSKQPAGYRFSTFAVMPTHSSSSAPFSGPHSLSFIFTGPIDRIITFIYSSSSFLCFLHFSFVLSSSTVVSLRDYSARFSIPVFLTKKSEIIFIGFFSSNVLIVASKVTSFIVCICKILIWVDSISFQVFNSIWLKDRRWSPSSNQFRWFSVNRFSVGTDDDSKRLAIESLLHVWRCWFT